MIKRNQNLAKLQAGYLFPEINRRKNKVIMDNPGAKIISLGIGNTTEPLTPYIVESLKEASVAMGTAQGYSGYGDEQGMAQLREAVAENFYNGRVDPEEVFISDGSKCDIARLQVLFGADVTVAVQNPAYPVYVDGSVIMGAAGGYNTQTGQFDNIVYMDCKPENNFFPDLDNIPEADIIYFCSPNNPTGATATKEQLKKLVDFAMRNGSLIVFDGAYSEFIRNPDLPRSIMEIEGAEEVAIEVNSFSKPAGFTGVRLGWSVVPNALKYEDGSSVNKDWNRIMTTLFNGASNIVQKGGLAAVSSQGRKEMKTLINYYMNNAGLIKSTLEELGIKTYGGTDAPYIWAHFPGEDSWDKFTYILEQAFVVTTPGAGFGSAGQGFIRFSAFGHRENIEEACQRLKRVLQ